ncbi:MAG: preprotein translocase subunit SecY [Bacillota bacterium]|nr:preprotein translocase subunit SecY [Bacillota bacterium]
MFKTLSNAWKIGDLRKKMLFTVFIIIIFRIGSAIPVPFLDPSLIKNFLNNNSNTMFGYFDMLTGGSFSKATIFALSITPYINSSIIIQLLTIGIPALERLQKSGDEGRKKIAQYTRYTTIAIALITGFGYYRLLANNGAVKNDGYYTAVVILATFTAGSAFIMWLGEQINDKGVGNGISIILFAGIVARLPATIISSIEAVRSGTLNWFAAIVIALIFIVVVGFIVFITDSERRIPIQYAKRVVGRKVYGGQNTYLPLKVNMSGVMPIIFASSILMLPSTIAAFLPQPKAGTFWAHVLNSISYRSPLYAVLYLLLIIFFSYFYAATQYNPIEMTNNIKKNGGFIPGIRPGKPSADFVMNILNKITLMGALFLGVIAILPIMFTLAVPTVNLALSGTSILIVVGVALETVKQIESQILMRHYKGFLE